MMQAAQDREGDDLATCVLCWHGSSFLLRNLLLDALMRPGSVEVVHICIEHAVELPLMQDQQVIEALTPDTAQEALTDGIGTRGIIRSLEKLDATGLGNPREGHSKLAIIITNEVPRSRAISGSLAQLLRRPRVGRRSCDAYVDHFARVQFDDEEGAERAEEEIGDRQEVAGPDLLGVRV